MFFSLLEELKNLNISTKTFFLKFYINVKNIELLYPGIQQFIFKKIKS